MGALSSLPALDVKPVQQPDILEKYGQLQQLRNSQQEMQQRAAMAPLQQQQAQQSIQAGGLQIQQQQTALNNQKAMTDAMHEWDGKDVNSLIPLVIKHGATADAVMGLKKTVLEQQQTYSKIAADDATTGAKKLETLKGNNDLIAGALSPLLDPQQTPDAQLPQAVMSTAQDLINKGLLDPQHAQAAEQIAQSGNPTQIRQQLGLLQKSYMGQSAQMEAAQKTALTRQENAAADKDAAEALAGTGPMADSRYRNIMMNQKLGRPISPEDAAWKAAYEKQKTLVPVANFSLQNAGIGGGPSGQPNAMAQAVASGQMKLSDVISPRTPMSVKNQFISEVQKINPNFDSATFGIETDAAKKATSGAWADTRLAYNTALDHSQLLLQAAKALKNGDVQALNSLKNKFGTEFGATGPITFDAIANAYNHEVGSVVSKGHITDKEVATSGATLPANASLPQIESVVGAYNSLMGSKRNELDKLIKAGAGNKANGVLGANSDSAAPAATHRYNPATGKIEAIQ